MTAQTETQFAAYPKDPVAGITGKSSSCATDAGLANRDARCHELWIDDPLHPAWNESVDPEAGIFGLPFTLEESSLVIIPVPWDAACSQGKGTAEAPALIAEQSHYVELHDLTLGNIYERRIALAPESPEFAKLTDTARLSAGTAAADIASLDLLGGRITEVVQHEVGHYLAKGKSVALLGGDHSVSLGAIKAHHDMFPHMGILQIDAHADLRPSLDGLTWSHASVMYHVMQQVQPESLVQVGIRATCSLERQFESDHDRIRQFTDHEMQFMLAAGSSWITICDSIIQALPEEVYLTLDIDGLDPAYCPNTGTPVPGGLSFAQLSVLLHRLVESGRLLRGFDLVEVGGHPADALSAAHLLYLLCGLVEQR